jgi:hypothetical protein
VHTNREDMYAVIRILFLSQLIILPFTGRKAVETADLKVQIPINTGINDTVGQFEL